MRAINLEVIHCSATIEGKYLGVDDIRKMHIWPCDLRDAKGNWYVKYLGKRYNSRSELPKEVRDKKGRGWTDIGYHRIITLNGLILTGRPLWKVGAHVKGFNTNSIGTVYIGGLDSDCKPKDTRTEAQKRALKFIYESDSATYPGIVFKGHRDFSPDLNNDGKIDQWEWMKACPCFDVQSEYNYL